LSHQRRIVEAVSAFDTYLQLVELTESPLIYHRWCFISAIGTLLGRNVWLPFGESKIFPHQYILLIGPPGARKSESIKQIKKLMVAAGYESFAADKSSKEQFLSDFNFGFDKIFRGIDPKSKNNPDDIGDLLDQATLGPDRNKVSEVFIGAGELQSFLGTGNSDFIVLLTDLWDAKDKHTDRVKNSDSVYIPNPTVNLLGGATSSNFARIFTENIASQGMLSRLVLVYGRGQRMRLTIPPPLDSQGKELIIDLFKEIRMRMHGPMRLTDDAYKAMDYIYQRWADLPDARLATYSGRRQDHLIKLMMICAVVDFRMEITEADVILANTILTYTELYMPQALGEFGKARNAEQSQIVLQIINDGELVGGLTARVLFQGCSQSVECMNDLVNILLKLTSANKIKSVEGVGGTPVFLPIKKKIPIKSKYIDMELLYEFRFKEAENSLQLPGDEE
jgi:hypothetical protein